MMKEIRDERINTEAELKAFKTKEKPGVMKEALEKENLDESKEESPEKGKITDELINKSDPVGKRRTQKSGVFPGEASERKHRIEKPLHSKHEHIQSQERPHTHSVENSEGKETDDLVKPEKFKKRKSGSKDSSQPGRIRKESTKEKLKGHKLSIKTNRENKENKEKVYQSLTPTQIPESGEEKIIWSSEDKIIETELDKQNLCKDILEEFYTDAWGICEERFYTFSAAAKTVLDLRDTWLRIIEMEWMDTAALDCDIRLPQTFAPKDSPPPLPLAFDSWSRGAIDVFPNHRRESVMDPFIHIDLSSREISLAELNDAADNPKSTNINSAAASEIQKSYDEEKLSVLPHLSADNLLKSKIEIPIEIKSNESLQQKSSEDEFYIFFPDFPVQSYESVNPLRNMDSVRILRPISSQDSISSTMGLNDSKLGLNPRTSSDCGARVGSRIFRLNRETTQEAIERWSQSCKQQFLQATDTSAVSSAEDRGSEYKHDNSEKKNELSDRQENIFRYDKPDQENEEALEIYTENNISVKRIIESPNKHTDVQIDSGYSINGDKLESKNSASQIVNILTPSEAIMMTRQDQSSEKYDTHHKFQNQNGEFELRTPLDIRSGIHVTKHDLGHISTGPSKTYKGEDSNIKKPVSSHAPLTTGSEETAKSIVRSKPGCSLKQGINVQSNTKSRSPLTQQQETLNVLPKMTTRNDPTFNKKSIVLKQRVKMRQYLKYLASKNEN